MTPVERDEYAAYKLKGVAQFLFKQWKETRSVDAGVQELKGLSLILLIGYFLLR